jgi:Glycosyl transferase 4-like domain
MLAGSHDRSERDRRRLAIVSYRAHRPFSPRGERTRRLTEGFRARWDVEVLAPAPSGTQLGTAALPRKSSSLRRRGHAAVRAVMLDKFEMWSRRRFAHWRPDVDAAVLIGHPFSPVVYASRRLMEADVPYVIDVGDPWVLTSPKPEGSHLGLWRSARAERRMWEAAAGAVVTTPQQAEALEELFPRLPTLVRPNGYASIGPDSPPPARSGPKDEARLRLVHFGMLIQIRVDLVRFLEALLATGPWEAISLAQFGDDFSDILERLSDRIDLERHPSYPWDEVIVRARDYDLALVLGNVYPALMPSKTVEYLTLPIPRLAVTHPSGRDAVSSYVRDRPGWLGLPSDHPEPGPPVAEHLARGWSPEELRAPLEEGWPSVVEQVVGFVERCVGVAPSRAEVGGPASAGASHGGRS